MNIGVYLKDLYTSKGRTSTIEWMDALSERGHDVHVIFPRDVDQMRWRKYSAIGDTQQFFSDPDRELKVYKHRREQFKNIRQDFKRLGYDTTEVNAALRREREEWKEFRKRWADQRFAYTLSDPEMDMLLFRKAGRNFQRDNAPQVRKLADAYPSAGQINDAQLVAGMDKTFMDRLDDAYTLDTRFPDTIEGIVDSVEHFGQAIIKPVDGRAGYGVARVNYTDAGLELVEQDGASLRRSYLSPSQLERKLRPLREDDPRLVVQQYAPDITKNGETRVLVVGGNIVGAVNTRPRGEGTFLSNTAKGASAHAVQLLPNEVYQTMEYVVDFMRENNISVARSDLIYHDGPKVNEINLVSPGTKAFGHDRQKVVDSLVGVVENYQGSPNQSTKKAS